MKGKQGGSQGEWELRCWLLTGGQWTEEGWPALPSKGPSLPSFLGLPNGQPLGTRRGVFPGWWTETQALPLSCVLVQAVLVDIRLDQLRITPRAASSPRVGLPHADFCSAPEAAVAPRRDSRPLIDLLVNSPDRNTVSKPLCEVGQVRRAGAREALAPSGLGSGFLPRFPDIVSW